MDEQDLGRNRGVLNCDCDLSTWRGGIMVVPQWCKAHRMLFASFAKVARYA